MGITEAELVGMADTKAGKFMGTDPTWSPVVIFAYNRRDLLQQTLEALGANFLAAESEVYLFADGPKGEKDRQAVQEVQNYIRIFAKQSPFRSFTPEFHEVNRGLASSVIAGVSRIIGEYGKVIVVEDDLLTSPDFLTYMNQALISYEKDDMIWSVSGYTPNIKAVRHCKEDTFLYYRASSWGWGTWLDRWEMVDWHVTDYAELSQSSEQIRRFNRGGDDMYEMLTMQMEGKIDSWAIRWCYAQSKADRYCVYPRISRVQNLGCQGGTHFHDDSDHRFDTILATGQETCECKPLKLDLTIVQDFQRLYSRSFWAKVVRRLKKVYWKLKK